MPRARSLRASAAPTCRGETTDTFFDRNIQLVLAHHQRTCRHSERRRTHRYPFPYPVRLLPVSADGTTPEGTEIQVLGKHLTAHGLDFYHSEPLPQRWVLAMFECGEVPITLLLELTWCRFGKHGWYENGGRFLRAK